MPAKNDESKTDGPNKRRKRKRSETVPFLAEKSVAILCSLQELIALVADGAAGAVEFPGLGSAVVYSLKDEEHTLRIRQIGGRKHKKATKPLAVFTSNLCAITVSLSFTTKRDVLDFLSLLTALCGLFLFSSFGGIRGLGGGGFGMPRPDVGDADFIEAMRKASEALHPQPTQNDPKPAEQENIPFSGTKDLEELLEKLRKSGFPMSPNPAGFA